MAVSGRWLLAERRVKQARLGRERVRPLLPWLRGICALHMWEGRSVSGEFVAMGLSCLSAHVVFPAEYEGGLMLSTEGRSTSTFRQSAWFYEQDMSAL